MMTRSLAADIWLGYGSFLYGFESLVFDVQSQALSLAIDIAVDAPEGLLTSAKFFESLQNKSKALLMTEVRIYFLDTHVHRFGLPANTLHLSSMFAPEWQSPPEHWGPVPPRLSIRDPRPLRPLDATLWQLLQERIWPELRD